MSGIELILAASVPPSTPAMTAWIGLVNPTGRFQVATARLTKP